METINNLEARRLTLQHQLDDVTTQSERNKRGQFATPPALTLSMLAYAKSLLTPHTPLRFLDPAFGTGAFYSALLQIFPSLQIVSASGFELDPHHGNTAEELWADAGLQLTVADFTRAIRPDKDEMKANLLICNPPYVRHHHLTSEEKQQLGQLVEQVTHVRLSKLSGLYCYFLLLSHAWMADNALAGWLIPSELMDVNYGRQVRSYLLNNVTLLRIHRFDPNTAQFKDAMVSPTAVWLRNSLPSPDHVVQLTYGGTLETPKICRRIPGNVLRTTDKWTRFFVGTTAATPPSPRIKLSDLFTIHRGIATGANRFFILTKEQAQHHQLPGEFLTPILPGARYLPSNEILADSNGDSILEHKLFLLTCPLPEDEIRHNYPTLWHYLQTGVRSGVNQRYLCRHRTPWYAQEKRFAAPFLCTYMGRERTKTNKPFRFILNHSHAIAANTYLMLYPNPALQRQLQDQPERLRRVWHALNRIPLNSLITGGREYGGGLHKLEPKELARIPADGIITALHEPIQTGSPASDMASATIQPALFEADHTGMWNQDDWQEISEERSSLEFPIQNIRIKEKRPAASSTKS